MLFKQTTFNLSLLSVSVAFACMPVQADTPPTEEDQLNPISVTTDAATTASQEVISSKQIQQKQPSNIKDLFKESLDVSVANVQSSRSGNNGVTVRGLADNRVETTVDGITLPEAQEAKHFISYGMEFGRGDYVEPTALRSTEVNYSGSENSLSSSVNFSTLNPEDMLKGRTVGGFVAGGFDNKDNSIYSSLGGAVEAGGYRGMVMTTLRKGHETKNRGDNADVGGSRTEADPAAYRNVYVLTKHQYQTDEHNKFKFTFESQSKHTDTDLLRLQGVSIDNGTGTQITGDSTDRVKRRRFSLGHEYNNDSGWLQSAKTDIYFQDSRTNNDRLRASSTNYRHETSGIKAKSWGFKSDLSNTIESTIPQVLNYGISYNRVDFGSYLFVVRPAYVNAITGGSPYNKKPTADAKQDKITTYIEDQIAIGNVVLTPHLGLVHYRFKPDSSNYYQYGSQDTPIEKNRETEFTPKFTAEWKIAPEFEPYFQYSRGVKTPSVQQLTSSFGETVTVRGTSYEIAVVGNPDLKSETADNFEIGFKGNNGRLNYRVSAYYNRYKNFIDWGENIAGQKTRSYFQYIQFENSDKAKIYGVTASGKWKFYDNFYTNAGVAYSKGNKIKDGVKSPINSVQPLKTQLGLGYDRDIWGTNLSWSYNRAKADKDIKGSMYNPTGGYSVWDLGIYYRPIKDLTLTANINNLFNKKYWNWNDISYLALLNGDAAGNAAIGIDSTNADRYTAPGRNFNVGVRYEF